MYDLKKVIDTHTTEGVIDFEKVMQVVDNDYVNPIIAKKTDKTKLLNEAVETVVKELGINGQSIDDIKLYVKKMGGSTDEIKEENLKLVKERDELLKKYEDEVSNHTKLLEETKLDKELNMIKNIGIQDADQVEFLHYKFNKQVSDEKTYEQVVAEYAKENKLKTTTKFVKDEFGNSGNSGDLDISAEVEKLNRRR